MTNEVLQIYLFVFYTRNVLLSILSYPLLEKEETYSFLNLILDESELTITTLNFIFVGIFLFACMLYKQNKGDSSQVV